MRTLMLVLAITLLLSSGAAAQAVPEFRTTRLYLTEAEFARAIQPYQQAIAANPRNARAQYLLGYAYLYAHLQWIVGAAPYADKKFLEKAVPPLQEAIKLDPVMIEAYNALHDAYFLMGDLPKSVEILMQMFERTRPGWLPNIGGL